jgi:hypothetical protein
MQNLGNVYIWDWGSPFVMSRTDVQNGVDIIFNIEKKFKKPNVLVIILKLMLSLNV